jgi:hypothetical protein
VLSGPSTSQAVTSPNLTPIGVGQVEVDKFNVTFPGPSQEFLAYSEQTGVPTNPATISSSGTSLFAKLLHPMESLLSDIPVVSGLEIEPLLLLLRQILEMREHFRFSDRDLFYVFHPRCSEPLRVRVNFALSQGFTVDQFHADILQHLVPRRLFDSLKKQ